MSSNSLRSHRVIIASLFLPYTVAIGQVSPDESHLRPAAKELSVPYVVQQLQQPQPEPTKSKKLKSIVEDLKDRTRHPSLGATPLGSPTGEPTINPFIASPFGASPVGTTPFGPTPAGTTPFGASPAGTTHTSPTPTMTRPPIPRKLSLKRMRRSTSRRRPTQSSPPDSPGAVEELFSIEPNPHCNGGLKNAVDSVSDGNNPRLRKKLWVGTLGVSGLTERLKSSISARLRSSYSSLPVFMPDDNTFERCYDSFCHEVLWPALHYIVPDAPRTDFSELYSKNADSFGQYVKVNRMFADAIASVAKEGDIIWVNDYHLMLLPAMLRSGGKIPKSVSIGFFMHVAFPSSEIFRCLSERDPLLRGILGADFISFQTLAYARHFRQTVSRILAVEALPRGIQLGADYDSSCLAFLTPQPNSPRPAVDDNSSVLEGTSGKGRFVDIGVFPMGIDVGQLNDKKRDPEVAEWVSLLKQRYKGFKILVGRDKLDEIQGVKHKIRAFEVFLQKYPQYQGKVVLIQIALPSSSDSSSTSTDILSAVSHINSRFSTLTYTPVVFLHTQDVNFSQYLALLSVADAFIVMSLREGMALRGHEYVVMQEDSPGSEVKRKGSLILSEFTGSYSYTGFRSCIAVNPWDTRGTANAIYDALAMPDSEAQTRWEELHNHVVTQSAQAFVTGFLNRCLRAHTKEEHGRDREEAEGGKENLKLGVGRLMGKWKHSLRRVILVDWEGSLVSGYLLNPDKEETNKAEERAIESLRKLSADRRNEVWVLSGLSRTGVLKRVGSVGVGLVAENGCFLKPRGETEWVNMVANLNMKWKGPCIEMLAYFTERTPNSVIEEREASVVWRFWTGPPLSDSADRQWARRQAAEAQNHIFDSLGERYGLRIVPGANSFLVIPNNISRSTAVGSILRSPMSPSPSSALFTEGSPDRYEDVDFLLAIGADETLLRRLNDVDDAETCSTSGKGTDAKWVVDRVEVLDVLDRLAEAH